MSLPPLSRGRLAALPRLASSVMAVAVACGVFASPASGHGAYHDVVLDLYRQLSKDPDNAAIYYKLAEAQVGHEEWKLGLNTIETVERLKPGGHATGFLRGWALDIAGRPQEARKVLDEFLAATPKHSRALAARARVCMKLGEPAAAAADFARALELEQNPDPEMVAELAAARVAAGDPAGAIRALDEAIARFGPLPTLLFPALEIETETRDWDGALRRIDALKAGFPRPEPWMARRAALLASAGREEAARQAWMALRDHLQALPSLERGMPDNLRILAEARRALGEDAPIPVALPPTQAP